MAERMETLGMEWCWAKRDTEKERGRICIKVFNRYLMIPRDTDEYLVLCHVVRDNEKGTIKYVPIKESDLHIASS